MSVDTSKHAPASALAPPVTLALALALPVTLALAVALALVLTLESYDSSYSIGKRVFTEG